MPFITHVIDDKSPLILYDNTWLPGTGQDPFAPDYYRGTFTTNNVTNGLVTFIFNGTAIWIYGAHRPNHGSYTVQVDSAIYSGYNGAGNNAFQQSLFNVSLSQELHTLNLTNTASNSLYIDIDMIVWQSKVGNADDDLVIDVVQDTDPRFQYQAPAWSITSSTSDIDFNLFANGTGHITQTYNASVTLTFTGMPSPRSPVINAPLIGCLGDAISIFGTSGPSNGPYSAQLDGDEAVQYNATTTYPTNYGMMLFHADNLGPGSHQVVLTNLPSGSGEQSLAIDHAQLWFIADNNTPSPGSSTTSGTSQDAFSSGAIAGIAVAVAVAILSAGAAIFFYRRWKAALASQNHLYRVYTSQQRPPEAGTALPSGFSSSLEARNFPNMLRTDSAIQPLSVSARQQANRPLAQNDRVVYSMTSGTRDSRSLIDTAGSPVRSEPVDEGTGRRPLPETPGGGLPLSAEFPKLASSLAGPSTRAADWSSITESEIPPNYIESTGNAR